MTIRAKKIASAYALVLIIGVVLRVHDIASQIVADDEMHSLRELKSHSASYIATHFFPTDISTPLALLQQLIGRLVGLSEVTARLPSLVAGIALLFLAAAWARGRFGDRIALVFVALLAVSPQLVYYSRYGRPYMTSTLLVFCAVCSFLRWWASGSRWAAAGYVVSASFAAWFSLLALPSALVPLGWGAALASAEARRRQSWSKLRGIAVVSACLLFALLGLLAPPAVFSLGAVTSKVGAGRLDLQSLRGAAALLAGTRHEPVVMLFWGAAVVGAVVALRRAPVCSALCIAIPLMQAVAVACAGPLMVEISMVYARYTVCALPFVLLLVAYALAEIGPRAPSVVVAVISGLFLAGPLLLQFRMPDNFRNHPGTQFALGRPAPISSISEFYCRLGRIVEPFAIVETPWFSEWHGNRFERYQRVHRKSVFIGFDTPPAGLTDIGHWPFGAPYQFRRFMRLDDPAVLKGDDIRYVLVHRNLPEEMASEWIKRNERAPADVPALLDRMRARYGVPVFEDGVLAVYRVDGAREPTSDPIHEPCGTND